MLIKGTTKVLIDVKNVVSRDVPDYDDNDTLHCLYIKVDNIEEDNETMDELISSLPPTQHSIFKNKSTTSSIITMDARIESVESNIVNLHNIFNYMAHMLKKS